MKELNVTEIDQVAGAGGVITDLLGTVLGSTNDAISNAISPVVGQTVQFAEIDVDSILKSLITF
ncbi:hypothetical protein [Serratia sp. M24T3]|uniref:Type A2 lantipeptide n=1 Tax=Rouxiella sp. WC2420 TaxID=3234145 RepID=A0AB39VY11_9GAMM|nr:hypothetical protein [Serratia sp. M24T3]EIC85044.1 hypothetical protein SPM24T3_08199 [Serratia sp. M24T3]